MLLTIFLACLAIAGGAVALFLHFWERSNSHSLDEDEKRSVDLMKFGCLLIGLVFGGAALYF